MEFETLLPMTLPVVVEGSDDSITAIEVYTVIDSLAQSAVEVRYGDESYYAIFDLDYPDILEDLQEIITDSREADSMLPCREWSHGANGEEGGWVHVISTRKRLMEVAIHIYNHLLKAAEIGGELEDDKLRIFIKKEEEDKA